MGENIMAQSRYHYDQYYFYTPVPCGDFSLYQLGELYCNETTSVDNHRQICDELSFITSGKGWFYENGQKYPVSKGDCFLSFLKEIHRIESDPKDPLCFFYIGFMGTADKTREMTDLLRCRKERKYRLPRIEQLFRMIIEESWEAKIYCNEMIGSLLLRILLLMLRALNDEENPAAHPNRLSSASLVYQISAYLQTHVFEIDALSHIGEVFNYNYKLLSSMFHKAVGETLRSYFLRLRMEKARQLLSEGFSVTETAQTLGYSTVHPFSRAYKTYFKVNPRKDK